jgi:hydroxyethylthiazole kinase-like uncharacterized protein yjeF
MKTRLDKKYLKSLLPPKRPIRGHKKSFGNLQIVAAGRKYPGAGILCCLGAFKSGCGFVRLDSESSGVIIAELPEVVPGFDPAATAFVVGPGIDVKTQRGKIRALLKKIPKESPLLIDGGALGIWIDTKPAKNSRVVLTPHEGEMAYLLGLSSAKSVKSNRLAALKKLAKSFPKATILLKGSPNLVASGKHIFEIPWGSVAMATAGQGDLLAGVIGAYLALGLKSERAVLLGVSLCALVADLLSRNRESQGVLAHEVAEGLPKIIAQLRKGPSSSA